MFKKKPKYANLGELAQAFKSGELDRNLYRLVMDNDCSYLAYRGPLPESIKEGSRAADAFEDEKFDECCEWFRGNGYADLLDACVAAGIPSEWV